MKKFNIITIVLLAAATIGANAQGMEDALRYSQRFYVGSARTMAMGNAFTALGGDLGAMGINPASTALYNCCEFSITGGFSWNNTVAGLPEGSLQDVTKTKFNIPSVAAVFSLPTGRDFGLVSYSFGFGMNKVNSFNSRVAFRGQDTGNSLLGNIAAGLEGLDNSYLDADDAFDARIATWQEILAWDTYLIDPFEDYSDSYIGATENIFDDGGLGVDNLMTKNYNRTTGGGMYDIQFNFGLNFNDRLYLGANANITTVNFEDSRYYSEAGPGPDYFQTAFDKMDYSFWQETSGVGANLQLGAIWVPADFLRLGATYTTPTVYELTDTWQETMNATFDANYVEHNAEVYSESPIGSYSYRVKAPSRFTLGAALVFGRGGLISADIERVNYSKMVMTDSNHYADAFEDVNKEIKEYCPSSTIFRLGAEMNIVNDYCLRAGYNCYYYNAPQYHFVSFGIGKRISENSSIDLAFRTSLKDNYTLKPYGDYAFDEDGVPAIVATTANVTSAFRDLMLTYRVKF
ncbi:MAG: hypothetical protein J5693_04425 [Bacteroidales bacterium]|nr:hypothetical protein [Bacteroidales bacterium]